MGFYLVVAVVLTAVLLIFSVGYLIGHFLFGALVSTRYRPWIGILVGLSAIVLVVGMISQGCSHLSP